MSLSQGDLPINALFLGSLEIGRAYLGAALVFDKAAGGGVFDGFLHLTLGGAVSPNILLLSTRDPLETDGRMRLTNQPGIASVDALLETVSGEPGDRILISSRDELAAIPLRLTRKG